MRRVIGIVLGVALAVGVVAAIVVGRGGLTGLGGDPQDRSLTVVRGLIGSEKEAYFDDPQVRAGFATLGFQVEVDTAGSRDIAARDLTAYDFVFPSSDPAADRIRRERTITASYSPFYSPMAVASFRPVVELLARAGVAARSPQGTWQLDMDAYLALAAKGTRWRDLPGGAAAYPSPRTVLVTSTDVRRSNSAAMYLSIACYVANGNNVVTTRKEQRAVLPLMSTLFLDQGYSAGSSAEPFENYLSQGVGATPLVMVYEAQFLSLQLRRPAAIRPDMVLLYPSPTILSKHVLLPLTPSGDAVGRLLTTDPGLVRLQAEFGYRTTDPAVTAAVSQERGLAPPPTLTEVVDPPTFETLEALIAALEKEYGS